MYGTPSGRLSCHGHRDLNPWADITTGLPTGCTVSPPACWHIEHCRFTAGSHTSVEDVDRRTAGPEQDTWTMTLNLPRRDHVFWFFVERSFPSARRSSGTPLGQNACHRQPLSFRTHEATKPSHVRIWLVRTKTDRWFEGSLFELSWRSWKVGCYYCPAHVWSIASALALENLLSELSRTLR